MIGFKRFTSETSLEARRPGLLSRASRPGALPTGSHIEFSEADLEFGRMHGLQKGSTRRALIHVRPFQPKPLKKKFAGDSSGRVH